MIKETYQKEDINQGPRAIKNNFYYMCFVFFTFNLFCFFPKEMQMEFSVSL